MTEPELKLADLSLSTRLTKLPPGLVSLSWASLDLLGIFERADFMVHCPLDWGFLDCPNGTSIESDWDACV
jgi:hypothetical protein